MSFKDYLSGPTRVWVNELAPQKLATILEGVYRFPGVLQALIDRKAEESIPQHSVHIGAFGEKHFEDLCSDLPRNYQVINTAKIGHAGDFIIQYEYDNHIYKCLVDIKNYKGTVPSKEIDKFLRDASAGNYDCGLLISYSSKFVGISKQVQLTTHSLSSGPFPMMYLSQVPDLFIPAAIETLCTKISIESEKKTNLQFVEESILSINESLDQSSTVRRLLSELSLSTQSQISKCQEHLIVGEQSIKQSIRRLRGKLREFKIPCGKQGTRGVKFSQPITLPPVPPSFTPRTNNLENVDCDPAADLSEVECDDEEENNLGDIIMDKYRAEDIELMSQIVSLDKHWDHIEQTEDGSEADFSSDTFTISFIPLKTLTKIESNMDNYDAMPSELQELFTVKKRKGDKYVRANLTQKFIDVLNNYFGKNI